MKKENILTIKDYELFQELLLVTSSIQKIYHNLYELEICNKQNSEEYRKQISYLNISIQVEDDLYSKFDKVLAEKIYKMIYNFLSKKNSEIVRRILNILSDKFIFDEVSVIELLPDEICDSFIDSDLHELDLKVNHFITGSVEMYKILKKEALMGVLVFLQEFIDNKDCEKIKNLLIHAKYKLCLVNKNIEINLLNDEFNISNFLYTNSSVLASFLSINEQEYSALKETYYLQEVYKNIDELLKESDDNYNKEDTQLSSVLHQCFIRSYFLLMKDESIEDANYDFHKLLEDNDYLKAHFNYKISEMKIIKCFKKVKEDRVKKIVLKESK